jgi:hypothetical protein
VFSTVHPARSLEQLGDCGHAGENRFVSYSYAETRTRGGITMTFHDTHRPLRDYMGALEHSGCASRPCASPCPRTTTRPPIRTRRAGATSLSSCSFAPCGPADPALIPS